MKNIKQEDLFPHDIIVHFSYHKCMTSYYQGLMKKLGEQFEFYYKHYKGAVGRFHKELLNTDVKKVVSVNNRSDIKFDTFPSYRGSHFIRDPRDLIVSGYKYHLWANEPWLNDVDGYDWGKITNNSLFEEFIESDKDNYPVNITYKEYLNSLSKEKGVILEMLWRKNHFSEMKNWNYKNENIIELKYEEIIGNEVESFYKIFSHYKLHPEIIKKGLMIVDKLSLKNKIKSETGHVRNGAAKQWESEYSALHKEIFKDKYGDLLVLLNYEKDMNW